MEFLNRPLRWLDQLYDVVGNQVRTNVVDLSAIQLVHDVAPGAVIEASRQLTRRLYNAGFSGPSAPFSGSYAPDVATLNSQVGITVGNGANVTLDPWASITTAADEELERIADIWCVEIRAACAGAGGSTPSGYSGVIRLSSPPTTNQARQAICYQYDGRHGGALLPPNEVGLVEQIVTPLPLQIRRAPETSTFTNDDQVGFYFFAGGASETFLVSADFICVPRGIPPYWLF